MTAIIRSPDEAKVSFKGLGICRLCKHYHHEDRLTPGILGRAAFDWEYRHRLCELEKPGSVDFVYLGGPRMPKGFDDSAFEVAGRGPQWLDWKQNGNVTTVYVADAAWTMDLSALAASATFVAGREATSQSNSSNYLDCKISGTFITGTTPTAPAEWRLYYIEPTEDTPTWPDVFDGTDSAETVVNVNVLDTFVLGKSGTSSATTNVTTPVTGCLTLAQAFGVIPSAFTLFFSHAQTAALKTDAGNTNSFFYKYLQAAVA